FNFLFKTALQGNALETKDALGFREATGKIVKANERQLQNLAQKDQQAQAADENDRNGPAAPAAEAATPAPMAQAAKALDGEVADGLARSKTKNKVVTQKAAKDAKAGEVRDKQDAAKKESEGL